MSTAARGNEKLIEVTQLLIGDAKAKAFDELRLLDLQVCAIRRREMIKYEDEAHTARMNEFRSCEIRRAELIKQENEAHDARMDALKRMSDFYEYAKIVAEKTGKVV